MSVRGAKPWGALAKVWYRYLQLAIKSNQTINWKYYKEWGSKAYIEETSFNKWWRDKGNELFTPIPSETKVIDRNSSYVTVSIPLDIRKEDAYRQIGKILTSCKSAGTIGNQLKYAPTGRVNANTLIRYQRMLEIDLNPKYSGKPIKSKADALLNVYEKNQERIMKQNSTLIKNKQNNANKRKKTKLNLMNEPNTNKLKGKNLTTKLVHPMIDPRVAHRWLTQGRKVLENVAKGEFPGKDYY